MSKEGEKRPDIQKKKMNVMEMVAKQLNKRKENEKISHLRLHIERTQEPTSGTIVLFLR